LVVKLDWCGIVPTPGEKLTFHVPEHDARLRVSADAPEAGTRAETTSAARHSRIHFITSPLLESHRHSGAPSCAQGSVGEQPVVRVVTTQFARWPNWK
jgi:hypothetical protein